MRGNVENQEPPSRSVLVGNPLQKGPRFARVSVCEFRSLCMRRCQKSEMNRTYRWIIRKMRQKKRNRKRGKRDARTVMSGGDDKWIHGGQLRSCNASRYESWVLIWSLKVRFLGKNMICLEKWAQSFISKLGSEWTWLIRPSEIKITIKEVEIQV